MKSTTTKAAHNHRIAVRFHLNGRVQGVGLRPAIARLAARLQLTGTVSNDARGVIAIVEGARRAVDDFRDQLTLLPGLSSQLRIIAESTQSLHGYRSFEITHSHAQDEATRGQSLAAPLPLDTAVCEDCLRETMANGDRRREYGFTSCAACGPRFSLIERMPFERVDTAMRSFEFCDACRREYQTAKDRRFHAQTIACPNCGPQIWFEDQTPNREHDPSQALQAAVRLLRDGRILAIKGLGGYQLFVDACSDAAVRRLRTRKRRLAKPLAVMVADQHEAEQLANPDPSELSALTSWRNPIVLLRQKSGTSLAKSLNPGLTTIGFVLPTTPLHAILLQHFDGPVVCTSGNREGEPLAASESEARHALASVADGWLHHNREIVQPIDDSVVQVIEGRESVLRLARGFAPLPLDAPCGFPLIALGGQQKQALAVANGNQAVLAPHLGDVENEAARTRMIQQVDALAGLYRMDASRRYACDRHPHYCTTEFANSRTDSPIQVQHHHAHAAAAALEHGLLEETILAVAFDGTGYGADGQLWGGEFLLGRGDSFRRVASLRKIPLAGGEQAIRQPWRIATALVADALGADEALKLQFESGRPHDLLPILPRRRFSPRSSSIGRLFDGVAALALGVERIEYEGQAAILLEHIADESDPESYDLSPRSDRRRRLDWRNMVARIFQDLRQGVSPGAIAMRFQRGLAEAICDVAALHPQPLVLCGGVFQNRLLTELVLRCAAPRRVYFGGRIPVNDGGLAAGQLVIAAARLAKSKGRTSQS